MVMGKEPVFVNDRTAGYVTTAAFGFSIRRPVAYAWLPAGVGEGVSVEIEYFGRKIKATVIAEPVFDPEGKRLLGNGVSQDHKTNGPVRAVL
jgi:glycine cleavage system aminomethyltransferase T